MSQNLRGVEIGIDSIESMIKAAGAALSGLLISLGGACYVLALSMLQ